MSAYRGEIARFAKWENNTKGDQIPKKTEGLLPSMKAQFKYWTGRATLVEAMSKLLLGENAGSSIWNPFYISFAKKVDSLRHKFDGGQLIGAVDAELNKWVARGLDRDILERIRNSVFTLSGPLT